MGGSARMGTFSDAPLAVTYGQPVSVAKPPDNVVTPAGGTAPATSPTQQNAASLQQLYDQLKALQAAGR